MNKIQVGFLVSYDYELLKNSIPQIYNEADTVFLAIDKSRKTWNGGDIVIGDDLFEWIKTFDVDHKIKTYEDDFYVPELTTMECEVRERKMLAEQMGLGNWLVQLDADEYFINFKKFVDFLKTKKHYLKNPEKHKIQVKPYHVTLYKKLESGYLYITNTTKTVVVTNYPDYTVGRKTKGRVHYVNALVLHECLSRDREELVTKLTNWGHNSQVDLEGFMQKWDSVNKDNFKDYEGFYYIEPMKWKYLDYIEGRNFQELFRNFMEQKEEDLYKSNFYIFKKNLGQFINHLFK